MIEVTYLINKPEERSNSIYDRDGMHNATNTHDEKKKKKRIFVKQDLTCMPMLVREESVVLFSTSTFPSGPCR